MILSLVQHDILRQGIPLGGFFVAFRITDLGLLLSPELWAAGLLGHDFKRRLLFVAISLLVMILAAICGPASAILMLPSLDWWDVPTTKYSSWSTNHFTLNAEKSQVWPKKIDNSSFDTSCGFDTEKFAGNCAAGGFSAILSWAERPSSLMSESSWNITIAMNSKEVFYDRFIGGTSSTHKTPKTLSFNDTYKWFGDPTIQTWSLSQTISVTAGSLITSVAQMIGSHNETSRFQLLVNGEDPPAPQAIAACTGIHYNITNGLINGYDSLEDVPLPFVRRDMTHGRYRPAQIRQAFELWNSSGGWPLVMWMQAQNENSDSPSIGAVMFHDIEKGLENKNISATSRKDWSTLPVSSCSIFAGWKSSELFIDPTRDRYIHSPSTANPAQSLDSWIQNPSASRSPMRMVSIDTEWANTALPPNDTILALAASSYGSTKTEPLGMATTTLISDAMSRFPYMMNIGFRVLTPTVPPNHNFTSLANIPNDVTDIQIKRFRYGYSYSLRGHMRRLAAVILVLHIVLALIHAALVFHHGYTSSILYSLTKILALAINSPPSLALENTCAGIGRVDTYKNMVRVREVSSSHLGLVVGDDADYLTKGVVVGKEYGTLGKGGDVRPREDAFKDVLRKYF
ncbi:hypothetical protein DID88_006197 [Monilinia fructigena]|uniref:Uncharacterized protein n=1 Tax=Monilinia fructigena TaxID=38457 RepID=A0A395J1Y3_9HELO|nr:hypothetical protein DID88_006197 [Monilinia fructigena]